MMKSLGANVGGYRLALMSGIITLVIGFIFEVLESDTNDGVLPLMDHTLGETA